MQVSFSAGVLVHACKIASLFSLSHSSVCKNSILKSDQVLPPDGVSPVSLCPLTLSCHTDETLKLDGHSAGVLNVGVEGFSAVT